MTGIVYQLLPDMPETPDESRPAGVERALRTLAPRPQRGEQILEPHYPASNIEPVLHDMQADIDRLRAQNRKLKKSMARSAATSSRDGEDVGTGTSDREAVRRLRASRFEIFNEAKAAIAAHIEHTRENAHRISYGASPILPERTLDERLARVAASASGRIATLFEQVSGRTVPAFGVSVPPGVKADVFSAGSRLYSNWEATVDIEPLAARLTAKLTASAMAGALRAGGFVKVRVIGGLYDSVEAAISDLPNHEGLVGSFELLTPLG